VGTAHQYGREGKKTMTYRNLLLLALPLFVSLCLAGPPALAQREYHGADSVFEKEGVVILWGILKGKDEGSSWVIMEILNPVREEGGFQIFGVEAVDPFSNEKEWVVRERKLERENRVRSIRSSFTDKTVRRILFFSTRKQSEEGKPDMVIFYRGVPDTTPELLSEKELENYFQQALERLGKAH
jgi:hypothetical protein